MSQDIPRPPFDPELVPVLAVVASPDITPDSIPALRKVQNDAATLEGTLAGEPFTHEERNVPGPAGPVTLSIFYPNGDKHPPGKPRPAFYHMHSGGMICGNRFTFFKDPLRWAKATGAVAITVEYRLAPEHPFPAGVDDCWAGLKWVAEHASELGIDPERLMVSGQSMGGNLAAAMAIRARDEKGPELCGQLLECGMFDDRMTTNSINQYVSEGTWSRGSNVTAWNAILGDDAGGPNVSHLAAVARAKDLSNLPPAYVSVGSAEGFRDEDIAYAQKLWEAGVPAELHVWPGGFHCFDMLAPDAALSKAAIETRIAWVKKMFTEPSAKL